MTNTNGQDISAADREETVHTPFCTITMRCHYPRKNSPSVCPELCRALQYVGVLPENGSFPGSEFDDASPEE